MAIAESNGQFRIAVEADSDERREFRRHDLENRGITIDRWDGNRRVGKSFGKVVDLSAGGIRIRTNDRNVRSDNQIRVRLELPTYAGIFPFVDRREQGMQPKREWIGWLTVCRVIENGEEVEVAGRLVDMDEMDRGMLGLYLSTQPMAA